MNTAETCTTYTTCTHLRLSGREMSAGLKTTVFIKELFLTWGFQIVEINNSPADFTSGHNLYAGGHCCFMTKLRYEEQSDNSL